MKTAVEFIKEKLLSDEYWYENMTFDQIFDQAKEMEKEQIINAHFNGCETGEMFNNENRAFITDAEKYYNKTFKQEEQ